MKTKREPKPKAAKSDPKVIETQEPSETQVKAVVKPARKFTGDVTDASLPKTIEALNDQIKKSDKFLDVHGFIDALSSYSKGVIRSSEDTLQGVILAALNKLDFYVTEKDRIREAVLSKGYQCKVIRYVKERNIYTVQVKQPGKKEETLWFAVQEKGIYKYGIGQFEIGTMTTPGFEPDEASN